MACLQRTTRFRRLLEHGDNAALILDAQGTVTYCTPTVERWLNISVPLAGIPLFHLIHPDDAPRVLSAFDALVLAPDVTRSLTMRVRGAKGDWRSLQVTATNLLGDETVSGVMVYARDVTDTELLKESLLHAQRMETTANRVARVGHELDNALTIILSHAGLLAKRVHAPDDLDVSAIRNAARGAYALTRQLLSLERKHPGHTAAVSVDLVLEGIHRLLQRVLGERISFNVSPGQLPVSVVIDPVRLDRALVNLVLNARDAIDDRGSIHLSCEVLDNLRSEGDVWSTWVRIRAIDDGHGMSAAVAARAFEPHFTTKGAAGSGLGLAIVRETIVEAGGSITVSSTPGVGTTVELLLPATVMSPDDFPSRSATNTLGGGETIVVLEKDPAPNPSISRVLQDAGYQVLEVPGVIDGLSLPNDLLSRAALIVADEMLNDASGHELVATFRHREPGMPVLHVSSTPLAANIGRRLDARTEFLAKPFDRASLLQRVRRLIDG